VGVGYNDTLMDEVTDAGKGAYLFVDSPEEARAMFDGRFLENLEISARDVQVELVLPGVFRMEAFYGEEYSTVPEEVDPQHLAPDDAMVFHQLLRAEDPRRVYADDTLTVNVTYSASLSGPRRTVSTTSTLQGLVKGPCAQMRKADAVVVYAQALMRISVLIEEGRPGLALDVCDAALDIVEGSARALDDGELFDIAALLEAYRPVVEAQGG
jgi:Ca-activated chloride channel family protein